MDTTFNIVLGIISGILTSAFIFLLSKIFVNIVMPWYQRIIYKGVDLNGEWLGEMIDTAELSFPFRINLIQNAHDLSGNAHIDKSKAKDSDHGTHYKMNGYVWEGYVTLNFQSDDRTRLSFATSLLQVKKGGLKLEGYFVFRDMRHDEIRERLVYFNRKI
jgi:hypothetical protein